LSARAAPSPRTARRRVSTLRWLAPHLAAQAAAIADAWTPCSSPCRPDQREPQHDVRGPAIRQRSGGATGGRARTGVAGHAARYVPIFDDLEHFGRSAGPMAWGRVLGSSG